MPRYAILDTCYVSQNNDPKRRIEKIIGEDYELIIPSLILNEFPGYISPELGDYLRQAGRVYEELPDGNQKGTIRRSSSELCLKGDLPSPADCQVAYASLEFAKQGDVLVLTSDMHLITALCAMYAKTNGRRFRNDIDRKNLQYLRRISIETHEEKRFTLEELYRVVKEFVC